MMVFMLILKIIGIVLCVIIGILAMILFVPVCYKVDADIDEMDYTVRARWLGWLIRFEFRWKEKAHAVLKILWFVIDLTDPEAVAVRKANKEVKARKKQEKKQKSQKRRVCQQRRRSAGNLVERQGESRSCREQQDAHENAVGNGKERRGVGQLQIVDRIAGAGDVEHAACRLRGPRRHDDLRRTKQQDGVQRRADKASEQVQHAENEQT